jgi:hypothetical protein
MTIEVVIHEHRFPTLAEVASRMSDDELCEMVTNLLLVADDAIQHNVAPSEVVEDLDYALRCNRACIDDSARRNLRVALETLQQLTDEN